jgi:hypothetical protein
MFRAQLFLHIKIPLPIYVAGSDKPDLCEESG